MGRRGRASATIWNILTLFVLVGAVAAVSVFILIFINPQSSLNPFPPAPVPAALVIPSPTPTSIHNVLPPTWTPTVTSEPTATVTPGPSSTPTITSTLYVIPSPTITLTPTATQVPQYALLGGVVYRRSEPINGRDCDEWMGVGGNVIDLDGNPVQGLTVILGGEYENKTINKSTLTGAAPAYGEGGYEFTIADEPNNSKETLYVQLFTSDGKPSSERVFFRTYDECASNLIQIDFQLEE
jgi:hypothetical protein